jgi:hypothetical protein
MVGGKVSKIENVKIHATSSSGTHLHNFLSQPVPGGHQIFTGHGMHLHKVGLQT